MVVEISRENSDAPGQKPRKLAGAPPQEVVIVMVAIATFVAFSLFVSGFLTTGNLVGMVRSVSILGILSIGMAIVVIGRGIDLSLIANMAIISAWVIQLMAQGVPTGIALAVGAAVALVFGAFNGLLVAFVEIPALFVTLASGTLLFGIGQALVLNDMLVSVPLDREVFFLIGQGSVLGLPTSIIFFVTLLVIVHVLLSRTSFGRFLYAHGDNLDAARITGVDVRGMLMKEYMLSALIAYLAGIIAASTVGGMDTQIFYSSKIFDVVLVVVLGGVSLVGARGSMWSVVAGTILLGILLNGMTLMNVNSDVQSVIKGFVLMFALLVDHFLHPRDEETARQGDL